MMMIRSPFGQRGLWAPASAVWNVFTPITYVFTYPRHWEVGTSSREGSTLWYVNTFLKVLMNTTMVLLIIWHITFILPPGRSNISNARFSFFGTQKWKQERAQVPYGWPTPNILLGPFSRLWRVSFRHITWVHHPRGGHAIGANVPMVANQWIWLPKLKIKISHTTQVFVQ
jgi:hypothetical protein